MTYDHWKTTEDDPSDDYDGCEHEDYEADILTGRATCNMCDYAWWQTKEELEAETERHRVYYEWMEDQERPWTLKEWVLGLWPSIKPRWPKRRTKVVDDIPF